jgi:hypothetical protein
LVLDNRNPNQITVQQVYPRTPAYYAGIRQGDVITTLGGRNIANLNAFTQGLTQANGNVALGITRAGQTRNLEMPALNGADSSVRTALRPNFDAAAGAHLGAPGAAVDAQGRAGANPPGATINTTPGATINPAPGVTTTPPATLPSPQAAPRAPATNPTTPAPAPLPKAGAGASGAAGANLPGANASGSAGIGAGATGGAGVNTPAPGATPATGAPGAAGPSGGTSPAQPK